MPKGPDFTKEAVLHAQHDMRNIPEGRSVQQAVISHAQGDMTAPQPAEPKERGFFGKLADKIGQAWNDLRVGDEHAKGMAKLGAHELTQAFAAFPDSNIRPMEEPGVFGNETMPHIQDHEAEHDVSRGQDKDRSRTR